MIDITPCTAWVKDIANHAPPASAVQSITAPSEAVALLHQLHGRAPQLPEEGLPGQFEPHLARQALHDEPRQPESATRREQARDLLLSHVYDAVVRMIILTESTGRERRLLVQNGEQPAVWSIVDGKLTQPGMTGLLARS